jgi:PD-(D/E)XK nuclease superfamily
MNKLPPQRVTSWSYSRYSQYQTCPAQFRYKHIMKLPERQGPALARGEAIHREAELYVKGASGARVPASLVKFRDEFKALRAARRRDPSSVIVEETFAFRADYSKTSWDDWSGCRLRVKVDLARLDGSDLEITDVKTGRFRSDYGALSYAEQLELYALSGLMWFAHVPDLRVRTRLLYVDEGVEHRTLDDAGDARVYTAADAVPLRKAWDARVKPMLSDEKFAPRPGAGCRWCSYSKERGGPCVY